jgi:hypothetical protein
MQESRHLFFGAKNAIGGRKKRNCEIRRQIQAG